LSSPQKENGYTAIANEIMEALIRYRIPGEQRQCLDFILRKTYGFNKKSDMISNSQFVTATGMKKTAVCRAIKGLILKGVIKKDNNYIPSYQFNKNYHSWKLLPKKITVIKKDNQVLSKKRPTKDTITKDTKRGTIVPLCPHKKIMALYHEILPELPRVQIWNGASEKHLQVLWRESEKRQSLDAWKGFFEYCKKSDFMMGRVKEWRADLMWMVKPANFAKIMNGTMHKYNKKKSLEERNREVLEEFANET